MEQARAAQGEPVGSFSIYQLKGGNETLDYRFEPLDSIHRNGLSVKLENYELVYEAPLTAKDNLESIYTRFNVDRPADFTGHSLSVSDIVVLHQDGKDTAHYCDRAGFSEVPEFLQPAQKSREITERIQTPRGNFYLCGMQGSRWRRTDTVFITPLRMENISLWQMGPRRMRSELMRRKRTTPSVPLK